MKTKQRQEYSAPDAEILSTGLENNILVGSTWNDGSLGDEFNELYNL